MPGGNGRAMKKRPFLAKALEGILPEFPWAYSLCSYFFLRLWFIGRSLTCMGPEGHIVGGTHTRFNRGKDLPGRGVLH